MDDITKNIFEKRIEDAKDDENELFIIIFEILLSYLSEAIFTKNIDAIKNADRCIDKIIMISNSNNLPSNVFVYCKSIFIKCISKETFDELRDIYVIIEKFKETYKNVFKEKIIKNATYDKNGKLLIN